MPLNVLDQFFCEPYRAKISKGACVARYTAATGGTPSERAGKEKCVDCPVGAAHRQELGAEGVAAVVSKPPSVQQVRAAEARERSKELRGENEMADIAKKQCADPECGSLFQPKRKNSRFCSKPCMDRAARRAKGSKPRGASRDAAKSRSAPHGAAPPDGVDLTECLRLLQELSAAEQAFQAYAYDHPDVMKEAKRLLGKIT